MKHFFLGAAACWLIASGNLFAQVPTADELNLIKYWRLRGNFREQFVKIGPAAGNSIVARDIKPLDCIDNINYDNVGFGLMHWGDGMIRHGYYMGLLATEYRLLKDDGQDVTGVLNELYYALNTINRLDYFAEQKQSLTYGFEQIPDTNGFYMREDIPEGFAADNWYNSKYEARCDESPHYFNNNALKLNGTSNFETHGNSYQNTPSLDQFTSLMVGFSLIHKLVDNEFVQPPAEENGFYIVTETQAIVHRMMTYLEEHNWMMIDVNGWPVNNGGGDVVFAYYPLNEAAERITGNSYDSHWTRKLPAYNMQDIQFCITGFGLEDNKPENHDDACDHVALNPALYQTYLALSGPAFSSMPPGPSNNQDGSGYQDWLSSGGGVITGDGDIFEDIWENSGEIISDIEDDGKFELLPYPYDQFKFAKDIGDGQQDKSTWAIMVNLALAGKVWNSSQMLSASTITGNIQAELINAVLRDENAPREQSYYRDLLTSMDKRGPYNFAKMYDDPLDLVVTAAAPNGWGSQHRWTWSTSVDGGLDQENGIFSGIDYLLFHNLYYLKYKTALPDFEEQFDCQCLAPPVSPINNLPVNSPYQNAHDAARIEVNKKLEFVNSCHEDALAAANNEVTGTLDVTTHFPQYTAMKIFVPKYQLNNCSIETGGKVFVKTRFIFCNSANMVMKPGSELEIQESETTVQNNSILDCSGEIRVIGGKTLRLSQNGTLILRDGGRLVMGTNAQLIIEPGGVLQVYGGGEIINNSAAEIILRGTIKVMDDGEVNIIHNGVTASKIYVEGSASFSSNVANTGVFRLTGKGKNDPMLVIRENAKLTVADNHPEKIFLSNGRIVMEAGATFDCKQPFLATSASFYSTATNNGLNFTQNAQFTQCDLVNVPIDAQMNIEYSGILKLGNCSSTATITNLTKPALINVKGQGFTLADCVVKGKNMHSVKSEYVALASTLTNCELGYNGALPSSHIYYALDDNSTAEITMKSCSVTNSRIGAQKFGGKLTLRCNTFQDNVLFNVKVKSGELNANSSQGGGYNVFRKTTDLNNLQLDGNILNIDRGYNYIELGATNRTITGNNGNYGSSFPPVYVRSNLWNAANTVPVNFSTFTNVQMTTTVQLLPTPVHLQVACPVDNGPVSPPEGSNKSINEQIVVYSQSLGSSVTLPELYLTAAGYMSAYNDSLGDDLQALTYLGEMFSDSVDKNDSLVQYWQRFGISEMKKTLENAFMNEQLSQENNANTYDSYVQKYADALNYMTDPELNESNFRWQYDHEINKAHLFRVIGHTDIGLNILQELEYCGIDSIAQAELNHWKQAYEGEIISQNIGTPVLDTVIVVDTTGYNDPAVVINAFSFGANIADMNNISYPNCGFFNNKSMQSNEHPDLLVYPNPARDAVTIALSKGVNATGKLVCKQSDGRIKFNADIKFSSSGEYTLKVNGWASGVYGFTIMLADGTIKNGQFVVL